MKKKNFAVYMWRTSQEVRKLVTILSNLYL